MPLDGVSKPLPVECALLQRDHLSGPFYKPSQLLEMGVNVFTGVPN